MASSPAVNIRPAQLGDSAALLDLMQQHARFEQAAQPTISTSRLAALIEAHAPIQIWVAEEQGSLLGYFSLTQDYATWTGEPFLHLDCLFLHEDQRKRGIGQQLFAKIKDIAKGLNIREIQWQTPVDNSNAITFYQRQGATYKVKSRFTLASQAT